MANERALTVGPIPAHAGEPFMIAPLVVCRWAYPRSRGGTLTVGDSVTTGGGLSPLTRGNHSRYTTRGDSAGPIPAHAGEP